MRDSSGNVDPLFNTEPIFIHEGIAYPSEEALQDILLRKLAERIGSTDGAAVLVNVNTSEVTTMGSTNPEYLVVKTEVVPDTRPAEPDPQEDFEQRLTALENKIAEVRKIVEAIGRTLDLLLEEAKA